ncbi:nose resistant to fluoxetine protein 6-like [Culicoides brevitarsis]|uniref:nose resistant to fluoxetine protein 6-like n=1 Tax=Culicoides brevitarsis TaxID=469753 RepID=UPI00307B7279
MTRLKIFLLILGYFTTTNALSVFNFTEYYQMPPMARFDEYERCILGYEELSAYCLGKTSIKPQEDYQLWNYIKNFSSDTRHHFRHDVLTSGLCINWCKKKLDKIRKMDPKLYDELYEPYFDSKIRFPINPDDFPGTPEYRKEFGDIMNRCVNMYLKEEYNLTGYTEISFCSTNKEKEEYDAVDNSFLAITLIICVLVALSTLYDYFSRREILSTTQQPTKKDELLKSFSFLSNWERLTSVPKAGISYEFRHIQAIRYMTMFIIIYGHINIGYNGPVLNPEYHEERFHVPFYHIFLNGTTVVQTFFFISGFLMAVHFIEELMQKRSYNFKYFWVAVVYRYLRLTPVYMYVLMYDATILVKSQVGPMWKRQAGLEKTYCRRNWWTNLLLVNNHVHVKDGCMPHSWYMAADTQLFVIGMFVMMVVWKKPKLTKLVVFGTTTIFCVIPGIITYLKGYDGVFTVTPEERINMNQLESFKDTYIPFYTNAANYFIGIMSGYWYHHIRKSGYNPSTLVKNLFAFAFFASIVSGFLNFYYSYIFYDYEFEKPAVWIAVYSVISKCWWGVIASFFMFTFHYKCVPLVSRVLNARIFQILGRVTYCVYLVHFSLLRVASAEARGAAVVRTLSQIGYTTIGLIYASIVGMVLCLFLEFPVTALLKLLMPERRPAETAVTDEMKIMKENNSTLKNKFDYYNNVSKSMKENCMESGTIRNLDENVKV